MLLLKLVLIWVCLHCHALARYQDVASKDFYAIQVPDDEAQEAEAEIKIPGNRNSNKLRKLPVMNELIEGEGLGPVTSDYEKRKTPEMTTEEEKYLHIRSNDYVYRTKNNLPSNFTKWFERCHLKEVKGKITGTPCVNISKRYVVKSKIYLEIKCKSRSSVCGNGICKQDTAIVTGKKLLIACRCSSYTRSYPLPTGCGIDDARKKKKELLEYFSE